jgi:hypothetical protein
MGRMYTYLFVALTAPFFVGVATAQFDCTGLDTHEGEDFSLMLVASGVGSQATDVAIPPGETGRAFVSSLGGAISEVNLSDGTSTSYLNLAPITSTGAFAGAGCLGLTFHPDFAVNGYIYVNYTRASDGHPLISRFTGTDPGTELVIVDMGAVPEWGHNGGQLAFGPFDGYLYISMGDGGPQAGMDFLGDGFNRSQNPQSLRGKLLRLDVDNPAGGNNYGIPADNPFTATNDPADDVLDEIYALGLRNPWRFAFDALTGDFYGGDVGGEPQVPMGSREELNYVAADPVTHIMPGGRNFEWRVMEGFKVNDDSEPLGPGTITPPFWDYTRDGADGGPLIGSSVTGGVVYRGCSMPDLHGTYIFGDWTNGWIASLRVSDFMPPRNPPRFPQQRASIGNPIAFTQDGNGEVYVLDWQTARLSKLVATGDLASAVPGDCNQDGVLDISDGACALGVLFTGVPPLFPCGDGSVTDTANLALMDWQPDGAIDLSDATSLLTFLFLGTAPHHMAVPGLEVSKCVFIPNCSFSCQ